MWARNVDPLSKDTRKWCIEASLDSLGVRMYGRPRKRSAAAAVTPRLSLPAIGWPPKKLSFRTTFASLFNDSGFGTPGIGNQAILGSKGPNVSKVVLRSPKSAARDK